MGRLYRATCLLTRTRIASRYRKLFRRYHSWASTYPSLFQTYDGNPRIPCKQRFEVLICWFSTALISHIALLFLKPEDYAKLLLCRQYPSVRWNTDGQLATEMRKSPEYNARVLHSLTACMYGSVQSYTYHRSHIIWRSFTQRPQLFALHRGVMISSCAFNLPWVG